MTLKDELDEFYVTHNIPENGGEDDKTFEVPLPGFTLTLPNYNWRRKKLHIHDLEHIINKQNTTWSGEMFIASWEIATGFWRYIPVCIFPFWTMGFGLWKHPASVYHGFMRGSHDRGIASLHIPKNEILKLTKEDLTMLVRDKARLRSTFLNHLRLILMGFVAQIVFLSPLIVLFLIFWLIF